MEIADGSGPICGELHKTKDPFLAAIRDWNAKIEPQGSFLCIYSHASKLGINSLGGRKETRITWDELAEALVKPVEYLWLLGCTTSNSTAVWDSLSGPVGHLLLATTASAPFRAAVKCFAAEIDQNTIALDGEIPHILSKTIPELAEKTAYFAPTVINGKRTFTRAFSESELKIRRYVNILPLSPGFYDWPQFIQAEESKGLSGDDYARFVEQRMTSQLEESFVLELVTAASKFVASRLVGLDNIGECVPISIFLSRLLETYGVWSYVAVGGVIVKFPSPIRPKIFYPDPGPANVVYGHAWLRVPPFHVVDLSLPYQEYSPEQREIEIPTVISENPKLCRVPSEFSHYRTPKIRDCAPTVSLSIGQLEITYVPYSIALPGEQLDQAKRPNLSGMLPSELLEQFKREHAGLQTATPPARGNCNR